MSFAHVVSIGSLICSGRRADVEYHHDIGAQCALDIDTSLGTEKMLGSVMW